MTHVTFKKNGLTRSVKVGFAWTVFFWGPLAFAARGYWAWTAACAFIDICTYGIGQIFVAPYANRMTARWLVENGWVAVNPEVMPAEWGIAQ